MSHAAKSILHPDECPEPRCLAVTGGSYCRRHSPDYEPSDREIQNTYDAALENEHARLEHEHECGR